MTEIEMNSEGLKTIAIATADFLKGIYSDPSVTLRAREASRVKEIALRQAIVDFESAASQPTKPTKKLKVAASGATPLEADASRIIPMEDTSVDTFIDVPTEDQE